MSDITISGTVLSMENGSGKISPSKSPSSTNVALDVSVSPMHSFQETEVREDTVLEEKRDSLGDEVWGAKMFLQAVRTRLQSKKVFESQEMRDNYPEKDFTKLPPGWNIALLGPTGAGKSSLVYTLWRAINAIDEHHPDVAMKVEALQVGWTKADSDTASSSDSGNGGDMPSTPSTLQAKAQHGTRILSSVIIQEESPEHSQIRIQDTKGQQFFDEKEASYADAIVSGVLKEGSSVEEQNLRYWITIGSLGFFESSNLHDTPHVILLVFDASLKSLHKVLNVDFSDHEWENKVPQLACYHRVLDRAKEKELDVFVCLTHIDVFERQRGIDDSKGEDRMHQRIGEAVQEELDEMIQKLSASLSYGGRNVPMNHIFAAENYRADKNSSDARIDLAASELLDALIDSADEFIAFNCPKKPMCIIS